jgi:hypothetical protein
VRERFIVAAAVILATVCEILDVTAKLIADRRNKAA